MNLPINHGYICDVIPRRLIIPLVREQKLNKINDIEVQDIRLLTKGTFARRLPW